MKYEWYNYAIFVNTKSTGMRILFFLLLLSIFTVNAQDNKLFYTTNSGKISFRSESKQELIKASSNEMVGVIDEEKKTFVFKVQIRTFTGFNSALQQEHFNEKFLESEKFPEATFLGKIIEDIDFEKDGVYEIRAKGKLWIHGVENERIIRSAVTIKNGIASIQSHFTVALADHNIKVPKVVHEKVSSEISVEISAELKKKPIN